MHSVTAIISSLVTTSYTGMKKIKTRIDKFAKNVKVLPAIIWKIQYFRQNCAIGLIVGKGIDLLKAKFNKESLQSHSSFS